ncbi:MAG: hypothetical protein JRD88_05430 [Deltaproteobacteria bacterium]|jgi:hypothetical protein|nr:hypothetical protein [Deltaproteobacteria bacterium]
MLYIIQKITSGQAEPPKVFADQNSARAAFTDLVHQTSAADFHTYCTRQHADPDSFATALAFAENENTQGAYCCYWELAVEAAGAAHTQQLAEQNSASALQSVTEVQQHVLAVQTELHGLSEKLSDMSQELLRLHKQLSNDQEQVDSTGASGAGKRPDLVPDEQDEKYQTAEWRDFVQSLIQMCGGNRGEFPLLSRHDWRQAIYDNQTTLEYWDWVAIAIDVSIERARANGYSIEEDNAQKGHFAFLAPSGERSSILYEMEDLAWCAAGLHAKQQGRSE